LRGHEQDTDADDHEYAIGGSNTHGGFHHAARLRPALTLRPARAETVHHVAYLSFGIRLAKLSVFPLTTPSLTTRRTDLRI
jgi:hypothetical protein